ncbi:hypothetical protein [Streptomyces ramulosus]|uniref:Uncharacterized protein n=2 Tax=Streptomyces ramulosus TaxID=47762 RepID=A0ABW1FMT9_9ACTN
MNAMDHARLLPWASPDGKPCYLIGGTGTGYVSRLADRMEAEQMESAAVLIGEARRVLAACAWTPGEIHLLAYDLNAALTEVHRVSESRGARLQQRTEGEDDGGGDGAPSAA